jgi:hypothetical protein
VRSLENRIPIIAPNVKDKKFGGNSLIVELVKEGKIVKTKINELDKKYEESVNIRFADYDNIRKERLKDRNNFQ